MDRLVALLSWIGLFHMGLSSGDEVLSSPLPYLVLLDTHQGLKCLGILINEKTILTSGSCEAKEDSTIDLLMPNQNSTNVTVQSKTMVYSVIILKIKEEIKNADCFADFRSEDNTYESGCYVYYSNNDYAIEKVGQNYGTLKIPSGLNQNSPDADKKNLFIYVDSTEDVKSKLGCGSTLICNGKPVGIDIELISQKFLYSEPENIGFIVFLHFGKMEVKTQLEENMVVSKKVCSETKSDNPSKGFNPENYDNPEKNSINVNSNNILFVIICAVLIFL